MSLDTSPIVDSLAPWLGAPRWWVGLSGGLDSCVLLHQLARLRESMDIPELCAVHIDHQLQADSASWQGHCQQLCDTLGVRLACRQVEVRAGGEGPEAAARAARYQQFESIVADAEVLLLAHHQDDQVETFFLRLLRGAGTQGLSGMPAQRPLGKGMLVRPLLAYHRQQLEDYARSEGVQWIEDDSNDDQSLDRNYLRHSVLPLLAQRWPGYRNSIEQSMDTIVDAEQALAAIDQATIEPALGSDFGESTLDLGLLPAASSAQLCRWLRYWLSTLGQPPPGRDRLQEFVRQLLSADASASPILQAPAYCLRRYRQKLYLGSVEQAVEAPESIVLAPETPLLVEGVGWLEMRHAASGGLPLPATGVWQLRLRAGGERCQPRGRPHSQSLKKLLQERAVPPWWRERLPLLYVEQELVAVADLWLCSGTEPAAGEQGYQLHWQRKSAAHPD